jgi:hypothetical protein
VLFFVLTPLLQEDLIWSELDDWTTHPQSDSVHGPNVGGGMIEIPHASA